MWARLRTPALPTPLRSDDVRHRNEIGSLLNEGTSDVRLPSPKKRARYSIHPIFDKYKHPISNDDTYHTREPRDAPRNPASPSPAPDSPMIKRLKRKLASCS